MDKSNFIILSTEAAPEVFRKVLAAKELLKNGVHDGVAEAAKAVGISRSTYYKYCDHVFPLAQGPVGKRITLSLLLEHESGVLSRFLHAVAEKNGNIMTISQDAPLNGMANASITFDISQIQCTFEELIESLRCSSGVKKMNIIAIE